MGLMAYHCEDCSAEFTMDERVADKVCFQLGKTRFERSGRVL